MNVYFSEFDWNRAPEWIQAIGAVFAAGGLVWTLWLQGKTLKEQQKVLKEQQIITQLEQKKFLDSRLPILELSKTSYVKKGQDRDVTFDLTIKENYLQNLKISHNFLTRS